MTAQPGLFFGGVFGIFIFLFWLAGIACGIFAFVLFVKLALRGIRALDLYNHAKNLEIRERYESAKKDDNV